jgi:hypothetical protein
MVACICVCVYVAVCRAEGQKARRGPGPALIRRRTHTGIHTGIWIKASIHGSIVHMRMVCNVSEHV